MEPFHWHGTFDPFGGLRALHDRMDRIFQESAGGDLACGGFPAIEVSEDADAILVTAELPGVARESLDITVTGDALTIAGERKPADIPADGYRRRERRGGRFERAIQLNERVDSSKIEATLKDGILRLRLPHAESAKPRKIQVAQG